MTAFYHPLRDTMNGPLPLAVSMGDPAGIGLDIVLQAFSGQAIAQTERITLPPCVLYADPGAVAARAAKLGSRLHIAEITAPADALTLRAGELPLIPVHCAVAPIPGCPDPRNAAAVIQAIEMAAADVAHGRAAAIVTLPIAKATLTAAGFPHPGHTEFLAELAGRHFLGRKWTSVMMLASDELRVVPLTVHVALARVASLLTVELICATARITATDLANRFGIARPRLWFCGLNPHAGESGTLGREEIEIIAPAIRLLQAEGLDVQGPFSADTMFHAAARPRYDAVIAMYHDQALIPLKTLAFDSGVNVTLGLPFVRTSPDHGTAFDIAGTGKANASSFIAALRLAAQISAAPAPAGARHA